jgi:hypothetical protein
MRSIVALLAALTFLAGTTPGHAAEDARSAVVGAFIDIQQVWCGDEDPPPSETRQGLYDRCVDFLFEATYRIEQVLEGDLPAGDQLRLRLVDDEQVPPLAEHRLALLMLEEIDGVYWPLETRPRPVFRTADGRYAKCGCRWNDDDPNDLGRSVLSDCRSIEFSPPVTLELAHKSSFAIERLRARGEYRLYRDQAHCVVGIYVEDMVRRLGEELWRGSGGRSGRPGAASARGS